MPLVSNSLHLITDGRITRVDCFELSMHHNCVHSVDLDYV